MRLCPKRGARGKVGNIMRKREALSGHTGLLRSLVFILSEMVSCGHFENRNDITDLYIFKRI